MSVKKFSYTPGWHMRPAVSPQGHLPHRYVGILKLGLPIMCVLILAVLISWPYLKHSSVSENFLNIQSILKKNPKLENKVINPKLNALDKKGRPFSLYAESALQKDPSLMDLISPGGSIHLEDGTLLIFKGDKGIYYKDTNILKLSGNVVLKTDKGYLLNTNTALFDLTKQQGEGTDPIKGTGPSGEHIQAQGFQIHHNSDTLILTGRTRVSLPQQ